MALTDLVPGARYLIPTSILLIICCVQLFEYTVALDAQSPLFSPHGSEEAIHYRLVDDYSSDDFFDGFNFEDAPDPTHGFVQYQSRSAAMAHNLTYLGDDGVSYIHADSEERSPQGRKSVRISTKKAYTKGLFILDVLHMPEGCATWPAFWSTAANSWPEKGEIDILEGVNANTDNAFTLHTGQGCRVSTFRDQKGSTETTNCDVNAFGQWPNQGCGVKTVDSFGSAFNSQGGAVVVTQWTDNVIRMWVFQRDAVPANILSGAPVPDLDTKQWGVPDATFDSSQCDIEGIFKEHVIIINVMATSRLFSVQRLTKP